MTPLLWWFPASLWALTFVTPILARRYGRPTGYPLALALAAGTVALIPAGARALSTPVTVGVPWISKLGIDLSFRLDALSLLFSLLVLGIGVLVLAFSPRYLEPDVSYGRYYTALVAFAAAMTTLVLADDLLLLYIAWELTTVASAVLIALRRKGRGAALKALLMNVAGGLALLAAGLLALTTVGDVPLHQLADPGRWPSGATPFLALLLFAAAAKSAQPPLHGWLPDAMVAPTPVSAYLHAAAMVKAGIYLLLRFSELLASEPSVALATVALGAVGAVFGAAAALRREDLKELLAYSTISQLGFIVALIGIGTEAAVAAALVHVAAHALYKSGLFLVTGATDHVLGTRRLAAIGDARRALPVVSVAALLCAASMAGLPPLLGYVSKEKALAALTADLGWVLGDAWLPLFAVILTALVLTVAYSLKVAAPFVANLRAGRREGLVALSVVPAVLATLGVTVGVFSARLTEPIRGATVASVGAPLKDELGLWHGATPAFWISVGVLATGLLSWLVVRRRGAGNPMPSALEAFARRSGWGLVSAGLLLDRPLREASPAAHLGTVGAVTGVVLVAGALLSGGAGAAATDPPTRWAVALLILASATAAAQVRNRLAAVAVVAVTGFLIAAFYVLHGAADLVLTQLVVDALTVALVVFVLRDLPASYPAVSRGRVAAAAVLAMVVGVGMGSVAHQASAGGPPEVAAHYLKHAPREGALNVVNAILTDYRALDTLAETTVLAVAAIGVVAVIRTRGRQRT